MTTQIDFLYVICFCHLTSNLVIPIIHTHICFEPFLDEKSCEAGHINASKPVNEWLLDKLAENVKALRTYLATWCDVMWCSLVQNLKILAMLINAFLDVEELKNDNEIRWVMCFLFAIIFLQWVFPFELFEVQIKGIQCRKRLQIAKHWNVIMFLLSYCLDDWQKVYCSLLDDITWQPYTAFAVTWV